MPASKTGAVKGGALAVAATAAGLAVGWLASGRAGSVATLAMVMAAANGYAKAYSP
jgi:hypothetical protein